jgi:predicted AAA+ superfamily ATPase
MPKLYFHDAGLACWLLGIRTAEQLATHPLRGSIFETFIISELNKSRLNQGERPDLYYWRDSNGNEIDVIAEQGTGLLPIEIKAGRSITREAFAGLDKWRALAGDTAMEAALVYGGDESYRHKEVAVTAWRECGGLL